MEPNIEKRYLKAYEEWSDAIYRHCLFRVYNADRAEELVQDTFMKTWSYLAEGKEIDNLRAFLYKVANNLVIDHSRKRKEDSLEKVLAAAPQLEPSYSGTAELETAVAYQEAMEVIQSLPPDERDILIMRFVDDLDPREIAEILGITANNASVKINRALTLLRSKFPE